MSLLLIRIVYCSKFSDFLQDNFVIVADSKFNNMYQFSLINGSTYSLFVVQSDSTIAVAYDPTTKDVYYSENGVARTLSKYSLTDGSFSTIYEDVNG